MSTSQYRDGVFSAASPAPRYGSLTSVFENGSLGGLEEDAAEALDPALRAFSETLLRGVTLPTGGCNASCISLNAALKLASAALATSPEDTSSKLSYALAAAYAGSYFGFPKTNLPATVASICDTFAMTVNQRSALHQQAMKFYKAFIKQQEDLQRREAALLAKGNVMSGVFRDGVLGAAYRDGVLGNAYRDGVLGHAYQDGVLGLTPTEERLLAMKQRMGKPTTKPTTKPTLLEPKCWTMNKLGFKVTVPCKPTPPGVPQQRAVRDGSLGAITHFLRPSAVPVSYVASTAHTTAAQPYFFRDPKRAKKQRAVKGLGCGCAGVGGISDVGVWKTVGLYGGAALALGLVFYAVKRK